MVRKETSKTRSKMSKETKKVTVNMTMLVARRGKKEVDMDLMASLSSTGRLKKP
jgi:hypothetical protein